jgi:dimethylargininase
MLIAITRQVSPSIHQCELSFHERRPIDVEKAIDQHSAYEQLLSGLGLRLVRLAAEPELPDAVFVEDPAVVVDEVAVISRMGAASRRPEAKSLAAALSVYRPLEFLTEPATLDGGDVMRIDRTLYVGRSHRTNEEGVKQLANLVRPYEYKVIPIEVRGCLHFKSACSYVGKNTLLVNRSCLDVRGLQVADAIDVPDEEPAAANALLVNDLVIIASSFPKTRALLERRGFRVRSIDMSELQKAEAGVTCTSLIFDDLGAQASRPATLR